MTDHPDPASTAAPAPPAGGFEIAAPAAVLALGRLAAKDHAGRWNLDQVRFGRDDVSAYAVATDSAALALARWDFDPAGPAVPEFGVPAGELASFRDLLTEPPATVTLRATLSGWEVSGYGVADHLSVSGLPPDGTFPPHAGFRSALLSFEPVRGAELPDLPVAARGLQRVAWMLRRAAADAGDDLGWVRAAVLRATVVKEPISVMGWAAGPRPGQAAWPMGMRVWACLMPLDEPADPAPSAPAA